MTTQGREIVTLGDDLEEQVGFLMAQGQAGVNVQQGPLFTVAIKKHRSTIISGLSDVFRKGCISVEVDPDSEVTP